MTSSTTLWVAGASDAGKTTVLNALATSPIFPYFAETRTTSLSTTTIAVGLLSPATLQGACPRVAQQWRSTYTLQAGEATVTREEAEVFVPTTTLGAIVPLPTQFTAPERVRAGASVAVVLRPADGEASASGSVLSVVEASDWTPPAPIVATPLHSAAAVRVLVVREGTIGLVAPLSSAFRTSTIVVVNLDAVDESTEDRAATRSRVALALNSPVDSIFAFNARLTLSAALLLEGTSPCSGNVAEDRLRERATNEMAEFNCFRARVVDAIKAAAAVPSHGERYTQPLEGVVDGSSCHRYVPVFMREEFRKELTTPASAETRRHSLSAVPSDDTSIPGADRYTLASSTSQEFAAALLAELQAYRPKAV